MSENMGDDSLTIRGGFIPHSGGAADGALSGRPSDCRFAGRGDQQALQEIACARCHAVAAIHPPLPHLDERIYAIDPAWDGKSSVSETTS